MLLFSDATDYIAQALFDYTQARPGCPDFSDPKFLAMNSANMNMSMLLSYESFEFPPIVGRQTTFGVYDRLFLVPYSSRWGVFIAFCGSYWLGSVQMTGKIEFKNPFGQLDADLYPVMISQSAILIPIQLLALLAYCFLLFRNRSRVHFLQYILPAVLVLGILASLTRSIFLASANSSTHATTLKQSRTLMIQAAFFALFYMGHRWLMLCVAYGPRMVRFDYGGSRFVLMALTAIIYGIIVGSQLYFDFEKNPMNSLGPLAASVLLVALNIVYFFWISYSLHHANSFAATSRHKFKVHFYEKFSLLFNICCFLVFLFGLTYIVRIDALGGRLWSVWWLFDFYHQVIYALSLCYLMWILRPNNRTNRYLWYSLNEQDGNQEEAKKSDSDAHIKVLPLEIELTHRRAATFMPPSKLQNGNQKLAPRDRSSLEFDSTTSLSIIDGMTQAETPPRRRKNPSTRRRREEELTESARRTNLLSSTD